MDEITKVKNLIKDTEWRINYYTQEIEEFTNKIIMHESYLKSLNLSLSELENKASCEKLNEVIDAK